jgi:ACS family hexuronate transporter-like MFS transporter
MQPVVGYILDLVGLKIGFALFAFAWSATNMLHAFAVGWPSLAFFRGLLGMSEAAIFPGGMKTISEWFPAKERSVATGWFNTGASLGAMIAPPLVVFCILTFNWQTAFVVTGALGFIWVAVWLMFYQSPQDHPRLSDTERAYILEGQQGRASMEKPSWKEIVSSRKFWGIAIPRFLAEPAWQTFNFWIPIYLVSVRHLDLKEIAAFAWLPFLAADLGCIMGGYLAPFYMKHFKTSLIGSRKLVVVTGCMLMVGPACIGLADSPYVAIALFCVGAFAHQTLAGALLTMASDVFGHHQVGTAVGLAGSAGWIGGTIFSLLVGALATTIGYNPLFVCLWVFDLVGAFLVWKLIRNTDVH